jgi:hypothetical protein
MEGTAMFDTLESRLCMSTTLITATAAMAPPPATEPTVATIETMSPEQLEQLRKSLFGSGGFLGGLTKSLDTTRTPSGR